MLLRNKFVLFQEFRFKLAKWGHILTLVGRLKTNERVLAIVDKRKRVLRLQTLYQIKNYATHLYRREQSLNAVLILIYFKKFRQTMCK